MKQLTLKQWKAYFEKTTHWQSQRGPNDICGYERDCKVYKRVRRARTWAELEMAVPLDLQQAVAERLTDEDYRESLGLPE